MKGQYINLNCTGWLTLTPCLLLLTLAPLNPGAASDLLISDTRCVQEGAFPEGIIECCLGTTALEGLLLGCSPRASGALPRKRDTSTGQRPCWVCSVLNLYA